MPITYILYRVYNEVLKNLTTFWTLEDTVVEEKCIVCSKNLTNISSSKTLLGKHLLQQSLHYLFQETIIYNIYILYIY